MSTVPDLEQYEPLQVLCFNTSFWQSSMGINTLTKDVVHVTSGSGPQLRLVFLGTTKLMSWEGRSSALLTHLRSRHMIA
jgi:hypothetical protein